VGRRSAGARWSSAIAVCVGFATLAPVVTTQVSSGRHPAPATNHAVAPPDVLSTHGDYATDVLSDPWDFSNDADIPPIKLVGCENRCEIARSAAGQLTVSTRDSSTIKLVRTWGLELAWGRDGQARPVDAGRYTRLTLSMCTAQKLNMGIHFWNEAGGEGLIAIYPEAGCGTFSYDLVGLPRIGGLNAPWAGKIVRLELLRGNAASGGDPAVDVTLDWVRLHRGNAPAAPVGGVPIPRVLSPNEEGGTDYAAATGNAWDFNDTRDVLAMNHIYSAVRNGALVGSTVGNDPFVEFKLPKPLKADKFHRFTAEVCYGGPMSFANAPGGGMNARVVWFGSAGRWVESQDIIIYPGCNRMTIDLATTPAIAVNDENTSKKTGWTGQTITRLRFDLNEDPGFRTFSLHEVKFADDAALVTAPAYRILFDDIAAVPGTTAEIYATRTRGGFDGVRIGTMAVKGGTNSFRWTGTDAGGAKLPNGQYWIYVTMRNAAGVGTAYATGPLRLQRA